MIIDDQRTGCFKRFDMIIAKDTFMSSWGPGKGKGGSWCAWATAPSNLEAVYAWVESRPEMTKIRVVPNDHTPTAAHFSIYIVDEHHPALKEYKHLITQEV